jgi:hypothetical protein
VSDSKSAPERRRNLTLRELLDELLLHVRAVARRSSTMTPEELEHAQQRLEWLAEEIWRSATRGGDSSI